MLPGSPAFPSSSGFGYRVLRLDGAFLLAAGLGGLAADFAGYSLGAGPLAGLAGQPLAVGAVEAHGLAALVGILLWKGAVGDRRLWHGVALSVHLFLALCNLVFWEVYALMGVPMAGIVSTIAHILFAGAHLVFLGTTQRFSAQSAAFEHAASAPPVDAIGDLRGRHESSAEPTIRSRKLIRLGGAASMLAGALTIAANLLHPPRSFETLARDAQHVTWEVVHAIAIVAFVFTAFALIALYAVQVTRMGMGGLIGFVGALAGNILMVGVLVPDSLIFPVLARDPGTAHLLDFPGPLIGTGLLTAYMGMSGVIYCLGTLLFFGRSARVGILPRWGSLLIAVGIVPLAFGALVWQGIDYVGAIAVGAGYFWLGYALWGRTPLRDDTPGHRS